jgi:hypothetical protein
MTRANAKIYIARVLGGARGSDPLAMAEEALLRGFSDWSAEKDWEFLLKDMSLGFTVASCAINDSVTVSAPSTGAFDGVNSGITVTGTGVPADTTVSSYTRGSDGTISSITLSAATTGGSQSVTLTFGGNIPIVQGVQDYNLPSDFKSPYGARLITNLKWPLTFIRPREWNRLTYEQTTQSSPTLYTVFNPISALTQDKGTYRLRILPISAQSDTLKFEYYRRFNETADPIDIPDEYLYQFLDYCAGLLLLRKRSFDNPELAIQDAMKSFEKVKQNDQEPTEDEDIGLISSMDASSRRPLWTNGPFDIEYGRYY